jgi:hypothetical protein
LGPFFRIIEQGLQGLSDGDHFFELLADDDEIGSLSS